MDIVDAGGSFGKDYGEGKGVDNFTFGTTSPVYDMLARMKCEMPHTIRVPFQKDSLRMTDTDREVIARLCVREPSMSDRVVIIHGTDTMLETAKAISGMWLAHGLTITRTIVLTGAGRPASMRITDADLQFGYAFGVAKLLPPGIYIAMNGEHHLWSECQKCDDGVFRKIAA